MKLSEIAARIDTHLRRFEHDKEINAEIVRENSRGQVSRTYPYYNAVAWPAGRYVGVRYVSYQTAFYLSKADALTYMEWLDGGNVGRHFKALSNGPSA